MRLGLSMGLSSGGAPWTPTQLPGLTLLLDASQKVTQASNLVSNWGNLGSAPDVTAAGANRPTYDPVGGPSGAPCIYNSGVAGVMAGGALGNYFSGSAFTIFGVVFIIANSTGTGSSRWLCPSFLGDSYTYLGTPIDSTPRMGTFVYNAGSYVANQAVSVGAWFRFIGKLSGGNTLSMSVNGAADTTAAGATLELVTGSPVLQVFKQSGANSFANGKIRAIGALNRATTAAEDARLNAWMQSLGG